jgi:hypothetical protein
MYVLLACFFVSPLSILGEVPERGLSRIAQPPWPTFGRRVVEPRRNVDACPQVNSYSSPPLLTCVHTGTTAGREQLIDFKRVIKMLWTLFLILLVLWFLGFITSYTMGGFIHLLLVVAIVVLLIRVIQGRRIA